MTFASSEKPNTVCEPCLAGLKKELQCHLPSEMYLKIEKNLDILNIKQDKKLFKCTRRFQIKMTFKFSAHSSPTHHPLTA